jgi:hypothetical protein
MAAQHGAAARDRLWSHPDLLPTSEDLDEPLDFVGRQGVDDELAQLTADDAAGPGSGDDGPRDSGSDGSAPDDSAPGDSGSGDDRPGDGPGTGEAGPAKG